MRERGLQLSVLYNYEMHDYAPSLSNFGEMNTPGNKSLILNHIVTACHNAPADFEGDGTKAVLVINEGSIPYQQPPKKEMMFFQYAELFCINLISYFALFQRVDIVFDIYLSNSLKQATRDKKRQRCSKTSNKGGEMSYQLANVSKRGPKQARIEPFLGGNSV